MADRDGLILQLYSRARAPNRDYYGLTISNENVVLNIWNITHGPHVFPKKQTCSLEDLQIAKTLVSEIHRLFGAHVADYCLALGRGDARLHCLPTKIFLKILRYLSGNDILNLGQTSKIFFELCNRNDVWGVIFNKRNKGKVSRDEVKAANQKGWKVVLRNKLVWNDGVTRNQNQKQSTIKSKTDVPKSTVTAPETTLKKPEVKAKVVPQKSIKVQNISKGGSSEAAHDVKPKIINVTNKLNEIIDIDKDDLPTIPTIEPKGILKKTGKPLISKTTAKLLNFSEKLEKIPESNLLTTVEYKPTTTDELNSISGKTTKLSLNSLLNGFVTKDIKRHEKDAKDRHLDRFLAELDEKIAKNPFNLDKEVKDVSHNSSKEIGTPVQLSKYKKETKTNKPFTKLESQPKISDICANISSSNEQNISSTKKMTSKIENNSSPFKGKSVHAAAELSKKPPPSKMAKTALIPNISELTRSINQIRGSFYNSDKLKIKIGTNLNNSKVANRNGCSQQLNNKLNNIVPSSASTPALELKKNALKLHVKSAISNSALTKVKNTNCSANIQHTVKPKSALTTKRTNVNVRNK